MNIVLLCNKSKSEVRVVYNIIASYGHAVTISDDKPDEKFLSQFELGVSWFFRHLLKPEHIKAVTRGVINNHIGYLPTGRGADPAVWSIVNTEPAGVTMHWIDAGIDTGPIIAQRKTESFPTDTWGDLYPRLVNDMLHLFEDTWKYLEETDFQPKVLTQRDGETAKRSIDAFVIDDLETKFGRGVARAFVNQLRSRTFPGKPGCYIRDTDGKKIYVRVTLEKES